MSSTEEPQDRPHVNASSKGSYGPDVNVDVGDHQGPRGTTNEPPTVAAAAQNAVPVPGLPPMQHDLEVAQACLNLRQESKTSADPQIRQGLGGKDGMNGGPPGAAHGPLGPEMPYGVSMASHTSPPKGPGMDSRSGPPMMNSTMAPMPPIPQDGGRDGSSVVGGGRGGMAMQQMPTSYIGVPTQIEFSGPNGLPVKENYAYYNNVNVVDNGGHFYPQFASEEQYHAMMNMREVSYYNMMGGQNDSSGMMSNPNSTHFFPTMIPAHEGGHFNTMMGSYPHGGGYMQQPPKRPHDDYVLQNDFKRSRTASPHDKPPEDNPVRTKKAPEKVKKGKRSSDMPRRPLSAYNFFFSEERERILAAIPDPDGEDAKKSDGGSSPEKVNKENSQNESNDDSKKDKTTADVKLSKEEMAEKMAARSKRLLALREQQTNKRRPHRKTHGKIGFKELVKMIGERWRALPNDQREYYAGLADTDLRRYKEQMTEYNARLTHNRSA